MPEHINILAMTITNFASVESRPNTNYQNRAFNEQSHHYNVRGNQSRPDSYVEPYANSHVAPPYGHPNGQQPRGNRYNPRMNGEPAPYANNAQAVYPQQAPHQSYDNVTAASGSNSQRTDQWGNSTDPSSVNSSLDRLQQQQQQQHQNLEKTYGFNGFGNGPQLDYNQGYGQPVPPPPAANGQGYGQPSVPPAVPRKEAPTQLRKTPTQTPTAEKKKSWFKKRFSKG